MNFDEPEVVEEKTQEDKKQLPVQIQETPNDSLKSNNEFKDLFKAIFEGQEFGYLITNEKQPLFVASDIAKILEYRDGYTAVRNLDDDEKVTQNMCTLGGNQDCLLITLSGLFSLIATSRKEAAKRLKKFVNKEILPQILLTGSYNAQPKLPQTFAEALRQLADSEEAKEKLALEIKQKEEQNKLLLADNQEKERFIEEEGKPAIDFIESSICFTAGKMKIISKFSTWSYFYMSHIIDAHMCISFDKKLASLVS